MWTYWTYLVAFLLAISVSATLTPVVTFIAHKMNWLDRPTEARKVHRVPVPRLGGVAVVIAFLAPVAGLAIYTNRISEILYSDSKLVFGLAVAAAVIVVLGVYDDLKGADARLKLSVQTAVALFLWVVGFRIEQVGHPFGDPLQLGLLSLPVTWLWVVGIVNAVNLIDGLDGLAAGISLFATAVLFGVAYWDHEVVLCLLTASLAGALIGFLFFNFNPARIFLGDSGSMFLGLVLAVVSMWTQRKAATAATLSVPLLALGLPILDTTLSFMRRLLAGRSPFSADKEHVHHRLMAIGLNHRGAVLTMYTTSAVFCLGALALLKNDPVTQTIVYVTVGTVCIVLIRKIGFLRLPDKVRTSIERVDAVRTAVRTAARRIRSASDPEQALAALGPALGTLGVQQARLQRAASGSDLFDGSLDIGRGGQALVQPVELERPISSDRIQYGKLMMELGEHDARNPNVEVCIELLCEALLEFETTQSSRPVPAPKLAAVVDFKQAPSSI